MSSIPPQIASDQLTHIISITAIAITLLGINGIEFYFDKTILGSDLFFLVIQNVVGLAGMAYYAVKFAITPTGVNVETDPSKK